MKRIKTRYKRDTRQHKKAVNSTSTCHSPTSHTLARWSCEIEARVSTDRKKIKNKTVGIRNFAIEFQVLLSSSHSHSLFK